MTTTRSLIVAAVAAILFGPRPAASATLVAGPQARGAGLIQEAAFPAIELLIDRY